MSLIGLDIGTTGCKAIVFSQAGEVLGSAAREYPILMPHPYWAEQDAERVWDMSWDALKAAVAAARRDPPQALALSCQGEAVIPVDEKGRALRPAILGHGHTHRRGERLAGREVWRGSPLSPHRHAPSHHQHVTQAALAAAPRTGHLEARSPVSAL